MLSIRCNNHINREDIKRDPQRITKIKRFFNKYN